MLDQKLELWDHLPDSPGIAFAGRRMKLGSRGIYVLPRAIIACHSHAGRSWGAYRLVAHACLYAELAAVCARQSSTSTCGRLRWAWPMDLKQACDRGPLASSPALAKGDHTSASFRGDPLHKLGR